jgi:NAD(P)H-hydrate epimerase
MSRKAVFGREPGAVTSAQMKEIERSADEAGLSYYQMMENAGIGAAEYMAAEFPVSGKKVLIFCGKGNNGGDGFVAARELHEIGASVKLVLVEGEPKTEDAVTNKRICETMKLPMLGMSEEDEITVSAGEADLIVDAIYGTGFHGGLREPVRRITALINRSKAAVYALDIPSGLNGDTGEADPDTVRAECTIAFHRLKPAHTDGRCAGFCGRIVCVSIGIEEVLN